ncbi:hypothetical protein [Flavobacterium algicola]|uniref:hypothetical protein n=1 Tax=Flavobacterium algicola TaxID=556529 RepID=UPI001EFD363E|nr:hypothetical protein [Flavobacterium algicola]MCG9793371.1 hypothetical protein [Flavobacterium algicola]
MKKTAILLLTICALTLVSFQTNPVTDFLSIGSTLKFEDQNFILAWSSHPNEVYYKQEYLRASDNKFETYQKMLIVEAIKSDLSVEQATEMKITELSNLKKSNPLVQYNFEKNNFENEKVISFMLSGGHNILEWNIYRYQKQVVDNEPYLVLYAYSYRSYFTNKNEIVKFLEYVKTNNPKITELINKVTIPKIKVK